MRILVHDSVFNIDFSGLPLGSADRVIVFLHGWGRTGADFNDLASRLARDFPAYALIQLDLPGFGGSPLVRTGGLSLADYSALLRALLEKLGVARISIVGHSLGGRIAIKFAALYPDCVQKLILISAAGIPPQSFRLKTLVAGRAAFRTIFYSMRDFAYILRLKNLLGAIFGSRDYQVTHGPLRETLKKVLAEDLRPDAAKITVPALIIWGANDRITPLRDGREYHALIKKSRLEILDGGHFAFMEKPDECGRLIRLFLQD